jgi:nucleotide-binding universal stress UspA family protein
VVFLRVVPPDELEFSGGLYTPSRVWEHHEQQTAQTYLQHVRVEWTQCGVPVRLELEMGAAPSMIIAAVARLGVSLIVMSTHGRSGLGRLIYGSVAEAVVRAAKVPVLFVPVRAMPTSAHWPLNDRR